MSTMNSITAGGYEYSRGRWNGKRHPRLIVMGYFVGGKRDKTFGLPVKARGGRTVVVARITQTKKRGAKGD